MERTSGHPQLLPATTFGQRNVRAMTRPYRANTHATTSTTSVAPGKSFVVPLFLSRASTQTQAFARGALPSSTRSRASTRSIIEDTIPVTGRVPPFSVWRDDQSEFSDMYSGSVHQPVPPTLIPLARNQDDEPTPSEREVGRSYRSGSSSSHSSKRHGKKYGVFSKKAYRDPHVSAKARISFAFGITLLVALVIYLVLAATGVAKNILFHVLSILFLLTLTGIFIHQLLRMFMLIRHPKRSRHRAVQGSSRRRQQTRDVPRTRQHRKRRPAERELVLEKPIPVHMTSDSGFDHDLEAQQPLRPAVQVPPPVYGNFRTSMRINPDLIHYKEVQTRDPSPLTPTYDEAVSQIHQTMGYRPPSYLSESGATEVVEVQRRDVNAALENIHPLERERMRDLAAQALEGRGRVGE